MINLLIRKSWFQALIITVLIGLWFSTGNSVEESIIEAPAEIVSEAPSTVRISQLEAQPYIVTEKIRAVVEAYQSAIIRSQAEGIVDSINAEIEGKVAKVGDILCEIGIENKLNNLNRSRANLKVAEIQLKGIESLHLRNLASENELAVAQANVELQSTDVEKAKLEISHTKIKAKFTGIVDEIYLNPGDLVQNGAACARQINLNQIKVVGHVAEQQIRHFSVGQPIEIHLITGEVGFGEISLVSKSANRNVRTFKIEAIMDNTIAQIPENISAEMLINTVPVAAHKIPTSSIVLNDDGLLVAKTLDETDKLRSWPIEIIAQDSAYLWVIGLPTKSRLVTLGHHYYQDGDLVQYFEEKTELKTQS